MDQHQKIQDLREFETHCDWDDALGTEQRLKQLISEHSEALKTDHFLRIELLSQLARAQGMQNLFPQAKISLQEAETALHEAESTHQDKSETSELFTIAKIRYLLEHGRILVLEKTPSQARPLFLEAWSMAQEAREDYYAIDAAIMLSTTEPQKMKRDWTIKAFDIVENSHHPRAKEMRAPVYTALGWLDFEMRKFEGALVYFKKALEFSKADGLSKKKVVTAQWAIAKTLRALNRIQEAFEIQTEAANELKNLNLIDGFVYEELAECLHLLKRPDEAQPYFELAYRQLSTDQWLADNNQARLKRMKELGKVK
jgi:tetratricopeptide (TPR) repeat protein